MGEMHPGATARLRAARVEILRHRWGKDPEFLCFGTVIGEGMVATVSDRGVRASRIDGEMRGTRELVDLKVKFPGDDRLHFVDWGYDLPMQPMVLLHVAGSEILEGPISQRIDTHLAGLEMGRIAGSTFRKLWRLANGRDMFGSDFDPRSEPRIVECHVAHGPLMGRFRNGADDLHDVRTVHYEANMDYPLREDLGGPVADADGSIIGVIIGADLGPQDRHQGAFFPMDLVRPFANMCGYVRRSEQRGEKDVTWRVLDHASQSTDGMEDDA